MTNLKILKSIEEATVTKIHLLKLYQQHTLVLFLLDNNIGVFTGPQPPPQLNQVIQLLQLVVLKQIRYLFTPVIFGSSGLFLNRNW